MRINVYVIHSQFVGSAPQSTNQGYTWVIGPELLHLLLPGRTKQAQELVP